MLAFWLAPRAANTIGANVGVRSGHIYSLRLMARLGLLPDGAVRASFVHDNDGRRDRGFGVGFRGEVISLCVHGVHCVESARRISTLHIRNGAT